MIVVTFQTKQKMTTNSMIDDIHVLYKTIIPSDYDILLTIVGVHYVNLEQTPKPLVHVITKNQTKNNTKSFCLRGR